MATRLDRFKKEMEPAKELYTGEIRDFAKNYEFLGEMNLEEYPDIDNRSMSFALKRQMESAKTFLMRLLRNFTST